MAWEQELQAELNYWVWTMKHFYENVGELVGRDNLDKHLNYDVESLIGLPVGATVRILDVGAGPLSDLGFKSFRYKVQITCIDPLAEAYSKLLDQYQIGIGCPLRSIYGEVEKLTDSFKPGSFDVVVCLNCLDHTRDPVLGLNQMVDVLAPDGFVYVWCYQNEGACENYQGLHQWDFDLLDNAVVLKGKDGDYQKVDALLKDGVVQKSWQGELNNKPAIHFVIRRKQ